MRYRSLLNPSFDMIGELVTIKAGEIRNPRNNEFSYGSVLYNIVVIGLGGTGGYVVRDLARFIYSIQKRIPDFNYRFSLVDGDEVEDKNLLRQNFLSKDLGKNKALVMADRHSRAFGINIDTYAKRVETHGDLNRILEGIKDHPAYDRHANNTRVVDIIVGCVDNNEARRVIARSMNNIPYRQHRFWIDSGNERKGGQVICGGQFDDHRGNRETLPTVVSIYPEILESSNDSTSQISCAERLMQDEQNIFVNIDAATHVLNFIRKIVLAEDFQIHGVEFDINGKVASRHLAQAA